MQFDILTIFPDIIHNYCEGSILGRAQKAGKIEIRAVNFRDFTNDKFHRVDDTPYGGGAGMVLQVEPIYKALKVIKALKRLKVKGKRLKSANEKVIILDPAGKKFDQKMAEKFSKLDRLVLICGRYEGFDERVYKFADAKVSVGDYVLSGGELPALVITEAVARLIPGVLGNAESLEGETHSEVKGKRLKVKGRDFCLSPFNFQLAGSGPQYTRPPEFMGLEVPKVLLTGDHKKIAEWRERKVVKVKGKR